MVMPSLLLEWTLARAEGLINSLIAHAPHHETVLAPLQDKRIRIIFTPIDIRIDVTFKSDGILFSTHEGQPVALTLTGTPIQFLHTATTHSVAGLHLAGDGKIAQTLQRVLNELNIDFAAFLESLLGGTIAHTLMKGFEQTQSKTAAWKKHTLNDIADYCHYEIQATASEAECSALAKDINTLRYAVDHLTVKVTQLKRRVEETHV